MSQAKVVSSLLTSNLVMKLLMAVTGIGLALFVFGHMVGHLQMFMGRDAYNSYAHFLKHGTHGLIWVARLGLLGMLGLHLLAAFKVSAANKAARPTNYDGLKSQRTSLFAKTMMFSGLTILTFVIYHLLHFTLGVVNAEYYPLVDPLGRQDVYNNYVYSFQNPGILAAYLVAVAFVSAHLSHALTSIFQTLGLSQGRFRDGVALVGPAFAVVTFLGFIVPPLGVTMGAIKPELDAGPGAVVTATSPAADAAAKAH